MTWLSKNLLAAYRITFRSFVLLYFVPLVLPQTTIFHISGFLITDLASICRSSMVCGPPTPPPYLEYKHAHCGYLHRLFCKVGVNRVNMKVFTLFAPSTLNVSKMEYTVKMGYIIINKLWWRRWSLSLWCKRFHGVKGKIISFGYQKII